MKLSEYMAQENLKDEDVAQRIGCDRSYVLRLRTGAAKPSHALMEAVAEATAGKVQPNDWFELPAQGAAA